jgi:hypothetical protein
MVAFTLLRRGDRPFGALYVILAFGFFVIAGEEISWGQRIFQVQSPEFFLQYNEQQELNIHNFLSQRPLHGAYILVSFLVAFGWYVVPKLLPRFPARVRSLVEDKLWMLLPDWRLMLYALPCMLFYIFIDYVNPIVWRILGPQWDAFSGSPDNFFLPKDQETLELFLAIGFFLFVVMVFRRLLKTSNAASRA